MRKLYNEFFYIPKHGKIREKVMLARITTTVVIMVMCLAAMSFTAYAYFSYNITSGSNIIKAANFETNVSITITDKNNEAVEIEKVDNATHRANLSVGNIYKVTLTRAGTASTGFCVISATGCKVETYHTQQLGIDVNSSNKGKDSVTFELKVTDNTVVTFYAHWGTSSHYPDYVNKGTDNALYITDANVGEKMVVMIINDVPEDTGDENNEPENTTLSTDTTTDADSSSTQTQESTTTSSAKNTDTSEATSTTDQTQSTSENTESTGTSTNEANK